MSGPLSGVRVVEMAALGPVPFAGMMLADLGADVLRIDRPSQAADSDDPLHRGKRSLSVDVKSEAGRSLVLELTEHADVLLEGFRPGVMEKLGLDPATTERRNSRLVYGRMTGWGQDGPLAATAGHDLNYLAIAGCLSAIGRAEQPPTPPLNLVGDFGGGGMLLVVGVLAALMSRASTGRGQVVDAAMVDGAALLAAAIYGQLHSGHWHETRGTNLLDSGAPFYDVYECADGRFLAVGAIESKFYEEFLEHAGLSDTVLPRQMDRAQWPATNAVLRDHFATQPLDHWLECFDGSDACVSPVLSMTEATRHPHNVARGSFCSVGDVIQPSPAPRFSSTPGSRPAPLEKLSGAVAASALSEWGVSDQAMLGVSDMGVAGSAAHEEAST